MTKYQLIRRLQEFTPQIIFDGTSGGIKLVIEVDAFGKTLNWLVQEGDHEKYFDNFDETADYYLEVTGNL